LPARSSLNSEVVLIVKVENRTELLRTKPKTEQNTECITNQPYMKKKMDCEQQLNFQFGIMRTKAVEETEKRKRREFP